MDINEIIDQYHQPLYNLSLKVTGSPEDAEDAVQDAFLNIHRELDRFRGESSLFTWIYKVTLNAALKIKKKKRKLIYRDLADEVDQYSAKIPDEVRNWMIDPEKEIFINELIWEIRTGCLEFTAYRLTDDQRLPYILRHSFELSYEQISEVLDLPLSSVKARLHRATENLRKFYFERCNWFGNEQKCNCRTRIGFAVEFDPSIIDRIKKRLEETPEDRTYLAFRKNNFPDLDAIYKDISLAPHDPAKIKQILAGA